MGHTSVEVRTDTYVQDVETGIRKSVNRAYLTEVCVDKDGRPVPVPYGLLLETENDRAEYEGAKLRRKYRKLRREEVPQAPPGRRVLKSAPAAFL